MEQIMFYVIECGDMTYRRVDIKSIFHCHVDLNDADFILTEGPRDFF